MRITAEKIHEFALFLLKDQSFDLSEEGVARFDSQYQAVTKLLTDHYKEPPQPVEGTNRVIIVDPDNGQEIPFAIDPLTTGQKKPQS